MEQPFQEATASLEGDYRASLEDGYREVVNKYLSEWVESGEMTADHAQTVACILYMNGEATNWDIFTLVEELGRVKAGNMVPAESPATEPASSWWILVGAAGLVAVIALVGSFT